CPTSHPARGCFLTYLFETTSAFGTVGLSMGVTPYLNSLNKLILSALMFIGRVGILTFAYVIVRRERPEFEFRYSEEKVMIG
ncbi:MAG: potassium transporter TrkG, partial [Deltaproteobacteria bacterium]|nr:potassium transporter TrkG [Deltaproteobacteria bacterium]